MGRATSIRDENRTSLSGSLCPACILIKVSTRQFCNGHGFHSLNVATYLHYTRKSASSRTSIGCRETATRSCCCRRERLVVSCKTRQYLRPIVFPSLFRLNRQ